jgi:hypothetical protein
MPKTLRQRKGCSGMLGNLQPAAALGWGRFGRAREFSMRIDRATTEKFVAMLGVTLSFLFLLALIAFAFV